MKKGKVYLVGAGPGDPGLLTVRGLDLLRKAEVVVYDRLVNPVLLEEAPPQAIRVFAGKLTGFHSLPQAQINDILIVHARRGLLVVRLKGGDPFVFGRGGEEAEALIEAGIPFEVVPGVSSAVAVPAYAGIPITHRGLSSSFAVLTGHEACKTEPSVDWERLSAAVDTLVILMGLKNLPLIAARLLACGKSPQTPAAVIRWGTTESQETVTGTLADIAEKAAFLRSPAVIVIGHVVALREHLRWFDLSEGILNRHRDEEQPSIHLEGLRLVSFESRRAREMAELIRNYGGEPVIAPSMREIPLSENTAAIDFIGRLEAGEFDFLILLTGVGTRTLVAAVAETYSRERVAQALQRTTLVARGPKPIAALRELGLTPAISAPEPNTWREILSELDAKASIQGKRVGVQEYGVTNQELIAGLEARGAEVERVPVYRWALPEDTAPLRSAIREILDGQVDMALFTNATQVDHLFRVAGEEKLDERVRQAFGRVLIASVGPVCTEALEHFGLRADLEPDHPKMGHLVAAVAQKGRALLEKKRASGG